MLYKSQLWHVMSHPHVGTVQYRCQQGPLVLQVVVPLGSMTWPNKKHEAVAGKNSDLPSSQRSLPAGGAGTTVV